MPVITKIDLQKSKKRVNIFLDGKFGFGLNLETYVKSGLKVEQVLTDEEVSEIANQSQRQTVYEKAILYASIRPRSKKEIKDWMRRKKHDSSFFPFILDRLTKIGLIDDTNFTKWWVEQRNAFRPTGVSKLKQELAIKGIDRSIIEVAISALVDPQSQLEAAKKLLDKKSIHTGKYPREKLTQKYTGLLLRRGFTYAITKRAIDELNQKL
jgi:regulatory protein